MSPIDYSIDVANPIDSALKGYQAGIGITQVQREQQQQQIALEQQQKQQQVIRSLIANPSAGADEYAAAQLLVPGMSKQLEQAWTTKNKAQQQSHLSDLSQWGAAIQNGQPQIAVDGMNARADALENTTGSPTHESQALRAQAQVIKEHPEFGNFMIKSMLVAHPDGKQVVDNIVALGGEQRAQDLAPGAVRKANADAGTAEADATLKNLGIIGQKAGALAQAKDVKPSQVQTMFRSLAAQGLIPKADLQGYLDGIPTDPKALPDYLASIRDAGIKPDDQKKFTTPDANTVANNTTSRYTADSTARTAAARLQFDKDQAKDEPVAPVGTPGLQGQKYLESLDKPTADQVKALAEGRLGFPVGKALQSPYWQKMITAVAQYDPSFDAVNYNARAKTRNDMVAGKSAENIKAINTAIAHMGQLNDQLSGLHNTSSPAYNTVANWLGTHLGNEKLQTKLSAADATAEGVAGEMAKVFRSTGMSEHEIDAWRKKFGNSTTPGQQKGTMQSAMHMLQGRMEAIQEQYKVGMGTTAQPLQILTPEAQVIFDKLIGSKPHAKAAPAAATGNGPAVGAVEGGYRFKGGDPSQPQSWEKL